MISTDELPTWNEGVQSAAVTPDLDSLATGLHVKADDLLKASPHLAPGRPTIGIAQRLTDAELVTLAMMQAMFGFTAEARWLRHTHSHLRRLFPYRPKQPGCSKRLRKAAELLRRVTRLLAADTSVWSELRRPLMEMVVATVRPRRADRAARPWRQQVGKGPLRCRRERTVFTEC